MINRLINRVSATSYVKSEASSFDLVNYFHVSSSIKRLYFQVICAARFLRVIVLINGLFM